MKFQFYLAYSVLLLMIRMYKIALSESEPFSIDKSSCTSNVPDSCNYVCILKSLDPDNNTWEIRIGDNDVSSESCIKVDDPKMYNKTKWMNKVNYYISMNYDNKIRTFYYFKRIKIADKPEQRIQILVKIFNTFLENHSSINITFALVIFGSEWEILIRTGFVSIDTNSLVAFQDNPEKSDSSSTRDEKYIRNMKHLLSFWVVNGKEIFMYDLATSVRLKQIKEHPLDEPYKKVNLMRDFFSQNEFNVTFEPAITLVHSEIYSAWLQLEESINDFILSSHMDSAQNSYTIVSGILQKVYKPNTILKEQLTIKKPRIVTYLMKQIIYNQKTIIFLIPDYSTDEYSINTALPCHSLCEEYGWVQPNQFTICCDATQHTDTFSKGAILRRNNHVISPLPIKKTIKGAPTLIWDTNSQSTVNKTYEFCSTETKYFFVLLQSTDSTKCERVYGEQILLTKPRISGLLIQFTNSGFISKYLTKLYENVKIWLRSVKTQEKYWGYYTSIQIFNHSTWFIKLSEEVKEEYILQGYKYMIYANSLNGEISDKTIISYSNSELYTCKIFNDPNIPVHEVFRKNNIRTKFLYLFPKSGNQLINRCKSENDQLDKCKSEESVNTDESTKKVLDRCKSEEEQVVECSLRIELIKNYLLHMWKYRYMEPVTYVSRFDMRFQNYESFQPCTIFPMWTWIYEKYWLLIEEVTREVIRRQKVNAIVYTLEYEPLKTQEKAVFNLYEKGNLENVVTVHRYIIKLITSSEGSIAILTINDIFLLMEGMESPFRTESDDIIKKLCTLDHEIYGYREFSTEGFQNIYSCQLTTKFIGQILKDKVSLTSAEKKILWMPNS